MRHLLTLSAGLIFGLIGAILFLRAGVPPALAALVFWMIGGAIGISLLQFAFLKNCVQDSAQAAKAKPLRAFLVGLLVLEIPFFAASCFSLGGAKELGAFALFVFFGVMTLVLWPANISYLVGQKLLPQELSKTRQVTAGSLVASTSLLVPVFGWLWLCYLAVLTTGGFCLRGRYA